MNKKGQSPGIAWIIGLLLLFALAIGFIVFNQVLTVHIYPQAELLINSSPYLNSTQVTETIGENDKYMAYWNTMPFIFVFLIVVFVIMAAIRRGDTDGY